MCACVTRARVYVRVAHGFCFVLQQNVHQRYINTARASYAESTLLMTPSSQRARKSVCLRAATAVIDASAPRLLPFNYHGQRESLRVLCADSALPLCAGKSLDSPLPLSVDRPLPRPLPFDNVFVLKARFCLALIPCAVTMLSHSLASRKSLLAAMDFATREPPCFPSQSVAFGLGHSLPVRRDCGLTRVTAFAV